MSFNLQKFLIENRLTKRSHLNEDAETKTDAELETMVAEEGDSIVGGEEMLDLDPGTPPDEEPRASSLAGSTPKLARSAKKTAPGSAGGGSGLEVDPEAGRTPSNKPVKDLEKKSAKLKSLEDLKDRLVMQLKSGQLKLDQYKEAIGNIPAQIIKLRLDIEKQMNPVIGDTEDDEEI